MGIFRRFLIRQTPFDQRNNSEKSWGQRGGAKIFSVGQKIFFFKKLDYSVKNGQKLMLAVSRLAKTQQADQKVLINCKLITPLVLVSRRRTNI